MLESIVDFVDIWSEPARANSKTLDLKRRYYHDLEGNFDI
jgi:hypothetical protein